MQYVVHKKTNEIIQHDNCAVMYLHDRHGNKKAEALISTTRIQIVKEHKWYMQDEKGYVATSVGRKKVYLHRFLLGIGESGRDIKVDHINRNPLDNRDENLRLCFHHQNCRNKGIPSNNSSGCLGISWNKEKRKWEAYIQSNKKFKRLGYFEKLEDAIVARKGAEKKYFGEFAPQEVNGITPVIRPGQVIWVPVKP